MAVIKYALLIFLIYGCANKITLTGGERDEIPPRVLMESPKNASTYFKAKEIEILFDELISLKNTSNIVVSPLIDGEIKYQAAGKALKIKLPDNLEDSTTYTFSFNGAVVDNNEGNALIDYSYILSTYSTVDSCIIRGSCIDAQSKEPINELLVGLYAQEAFLIDSLKPKYIASTNESGVFELKGVREGSYFIRVIKDDNRDYKLQKTELFGFRNNVQKIDSFLDSVLIEMSTNRNNPATYEILSNEYSFPKIVLSKPSEVIDLVGVNQKKVPYHINTSRDTISLKTALRDTTLLLSLSDNSTDTIYIPDLVAADDNKQSVSLAIASEKIRGKRATVISNIRIDSIDLSKVHLFKDSVELNTDSISLGLENNIQVYFTKPQDLNGARIVVDSAAVYSSTVTNNNFSGAIAFVNSDDIGSIEFTLEGERKGNLIAILEDAGGVVKGRKIINVSTQKFQFNQLYDGAYFLRLIYDVNENKIWDSADFEAMEQPEKIEILGPYRLEKGWDLLGNKIGLN